MNIKGCIFDLDGVVLKDYKEISNVSFKLITPDDLVDGFLIFLKELKNKGIQVAVISHRTELKDILDRLRITHLINVYVSNVEFILQNKKTLVCKTIAPLLNLSEEEILIFENQKPISQIRVWIYHSENTFHTTINDFSSHKFTQLISSLTNI